MADHDIRAAGHRAVHRVLGEHFAEDRIGAVRRQAADQVRRVEVFDCQVDVALLAPGSDRVAQEFADVVVQLVSGFVALFGVLLEQVLPGALGDDDDRVLAELEPPLEARQKRVFAVVERERVLRDQAVVHMRVGQCRISCDEAGVAPHHVDEPDAVRRPFRFVVRGGDDRAGRVDRGLETEGLVDVIDVVVDGFRDADHADVESATFDFERDVVRTAQRAVTADAEQQLDVHALERFDHDRFILAAAGAAEHGAAVLVDRVDRIGRQQHRFIAERGVQPLVAVADAEDDRNVVAQHQCPGQSLDHVVESGAEPARRQDRRMGPGGVVVNLLARAGRFEGADFTGVFELFLDFVDIFRIDDRRVFGNELHAGQRRRNGRRAEVFDCKVGYLHHDFHPIRLGAAEPRGMLFRNYKITPMCENFNRTAEPIA